MKVFGLLVFLAINCTTLKAADEDAVLLQKRDALHHNTVAGDADKVNSDLLGDTSAGDADDFTDAGEVTDLEFFGELLGCADPLR